MEIRPFSVGWFSVSTAYTVAGIALNYKKILPLNIGCLVRFRIDLPSCNHSCLPIQYRPDKIHFHVVVSFLLLSNPIVSDQIGNHHFILTTNGTLPSTRASTSISQQYGTG